MLCWKQGMAAAALVGLKPPTGATPGLSKYTLPWGPHLSLRTLLRFEQS